MTRLGYSLWICNFCSKGIRDQCLECTRRNPKSQRKNLEKDCTTPLFHIFFEIKRCGCHANEKTLTWGKLDICAINLENYSLSCEVVFFTFSASVLSLIQNSRAGFVVLEWLLLFPEDSKKSASTIKRQFFFTTACMEEIHHNKPNLILSYTTYCITTTAGSFIPCTFFENVYKPSCTISECMWHHCQLEANVDSITVILRQSSRATFTGIRLSVPVKRALMNWLHWET